VTPLLQRLLQRFVERGVLPPLPVSEAGLLVVQIMRGFTHLRRFIAADATRLLTLSRRPPNPGFLVAAIKFVRSDRYSLAAVWDKESVVGCSSPRTAKCAELSKACRRFFCAPLFTPEPRKLPPESEGTRRRRSSAPWCRVVLSPRKPHMNAATPRRVGRVRCKTLL